MKKILLIATALVMTLSASARLEGPKNFKSSMPEKVKKMMLDKKIATVKANVMGNNATTLLSKEFKAPAKAEAKTLIPCYTLDSYVWLTCAGGFTTKGMSEGEAYLVEGNKAYLQLFEEGLAPLEGEVFSGSNYMQSLYGDETKVDSITFTVGVVYTGETATYDIAVCDYDRSIGIYKTNQKTFGAYYFADYGELYVPEILGLFSDEDTNPIIAGAYFDMQPQALFADYIYPGKINYFDHWAQQEVTTLGTFCMLSDGIAFKSIEDFDSWVKLCYPENETTGEYDYSMASTIDEEYIGTYTFQAGDGDVIVAAVKSDASGFDDQASFFIEESEENQTVTLTSDGMSNLVFYVIISSESQGIAVWTENLKCRLYIDRQVKLDDGFGGEIASIAQVGYGKTTNNAVFDLQGRKIDGKNLQKGLYIINNKKVVLK